jgi:hypothetical protein
MVSASSSRLRGLAEAVKAARDMTLSLLKRLPDEAASLPVEQAGGWTVGALAAYVASVGYTWRRLLDRALAGEAEKTPDERRTLADQEVAAHYAQVPLEEAHQATGKGLDRVLSALGSMMSDADLDRPFYEPGKFTPTTIEGAVRRVLLGDLTRYSSWIRRAVVGTVEIDFPADGGLTLRLASDGLSVMRGESMLMQVQQATDYHEGGILITAEGGAELGWPQGSLISPDVMYDVEAHWGGDHDPRWTMGLWMRGSQITPTHAYGLAWRELLRWPPARQIDYETDARTVVGLMAEALDIKQRMVYLQGGRLPVSAKPASLPVELQDGRLETTTRGLRIRLRELRTQAHEIHMDMSSRELRLPDRTLSLATAREVRVEMPRVTPGTSISHLDAVIYLDFGGESIHLGVVRGNIGDTSDQANIRRAIARIQDHALSVGAIFSSRLDVPLFAETLPD